MKGIVFREFLDMVESQLSPAIADRMITQAAVPTQGAYTAVGTYPHEEMVHLVRALADITGTAVPALLRHFGQHLAGRFATLHPGFFRTQPTLIGFLASIDAVIHAEVRKLYPDAELPSLTVLARSEHHIRLRYGSSRHLEDLALGLIEGTARHYGETVHITRQPGEDGAILFEVFHRDPTHTA